MGSIAKSRYRIRNSDRSRKGFFLLMTSLLVLRSHTQHPVVQNKAEQQDDQEINQRECGGRPKVELPHPLLCQVLAKHGCGIARPSPRPHKIGRPSLMERVCPSVSFFV